MKKIHRLLEGKRVPVQVQPTVLASDQRRPLEQLANRQDHMARQCPGNHRACGQRVLDRGRQGRRSSGTSCSRKNYLPCKLFFCKRDFSAGSANSVLNGSNMNIGVDPNPGKIWIQTSLLPRPQYPVRLSDKTFKTVTNYCRRETGQGEASSSVEPSEDSGVGSQTNGETDTLHGLELSDSSPAPAPTRLVNTRISFESLATPQILFF